MARLLKGLPKLESINQWVKEVESKGLRFGPYCLDSQHGVVIHSALLPFTPKPRRRERVRAYIEESLAEELGRIVDWYQSNDENFDRSKYAQDLSDTAQTEKASLVRKGSPLVGLFRKRKVADLFTALTISPRLLAPNVDSLLGQKTRYSKAVKKAIEGHLRTEGSDCPTEENFFWGGLESFILEYAHLYRWGDDPEADEQGHDYDFDTSITEDLDRKLTNECIRHISAQFDQLDAYEISSDQCYFTLGKFFFFVLLVGYDENRDVTDICVFDGFNEW